MRIKFEIDLTLDLINRVDRVASRLNLSIPAYVEYCIALQTEINSAEQGGVDPSIPPISPESLTAPVTGFQTLPSVAFPDHRP